MSSSLAPLRTAEYKYSDPLASCAHVYILPLIRQLLSKPGPGTRILDLGCGNGAVMGNIARPEWELRGVDASVSGIDMARLAHPGFNFQVGDITGPVEDLGCPTSYFDVVISTEVVEHVICTPEPGRECVPGAPSGR